MVGTMASGMTSYEQGKQTWHNTVRQMAEQEIVDAETTRRMENQLSGLEGTQAARYGASGVEMEGSPADVMLATEREGRQGIAYKEMMDQTKLLEMRKAGRQAKKAGQMALWGSIAGTVGNTISGLLGGIFGSSSGSDFGTRMEQGGLSLLGNR